MPHLTQQTDGIAGLWDGDYDLQPVARFKPSGRLECHALFADVMRNGVKSICGRNAVHFKSRRTPRIPPSGRVRLRAQSLRRHEENSSRARTLPQVTDVACT